MRLFITSSCSRACHNICNGLTSKRILPLRLLVVCFSGGRQRESVWGHQLPHRERVRAHRAVLLPAAGLRLLPQLAHRGQVLRSGGAQWQGHPSSSHAGQFMVYTFLYRMWPQSTSADWNGKKSDQQRPDESPSPKWGPIELFIIFLLLIRPSSEVNIGVWCDLGLGTCVWP